MTSPGSEGSGRSELRRITLLADEQLPLLPINRYPHTVIDPATLPISPALLSRFLRWSESYYAEDGDLPTTFWDEAVALQTLLEAELDGLYSVRLDHNAFRSLP